MDTKLKSGDLVQFCFTAKQLAYVAHWHLRKNCKNIVPGYPNTELWTNGDRASLCYKELQGHLAEIINAAGLLLYIPALDLYTAGIMAIEPLKTC